MLKISWLVAGALAVATPAWALDPNRAITQLIHTAWTAKDGAPTDIAALAQTTDGYLWLGTSSGLFRFDGMRFVRFQPRGDETLPGVRIHRLLATRDGVLWISSGIGAWSRLFDGHLSKPENLPPTYELVECPDGSLLAATLNGLAVLKDGAWQDVGKEWHFPGKQARAAYFDRAGTLWVATEDRLVNRPAGQSGFLDPGDLVRLVLNFAQAPNGAIWVAVYDDRFPHAIRRIDDHGPATEVREGAGRVHFDRDGSLWIVSTGEGLRRVAHPERITGRSIEELGPEAELFTAKDGLSGDIGLSILEDREGDIWIGTIKGLDRFRAGSFTPVSIPQPEIARLFLPTRDGGLWAASPIPDSIDIQRIGPRGDHAVVKNRYALTALCEDPEGVIWGAGGRFVLRFQGGRMIPVPLAHGTPPKDIASMTCDQAGALWLLDREQGLFRFAHGTLTKVAENPLRARLEGHLHADRQGRIWWGRTNRIGLYDHGTLKEFGPDEGVKPGLVFCFHEDRAGRLWAVGDAGLTRFENGRFRTLSPGNGFPARSAYGVAEDDDGTWWISCDLGVLRIAASELDRALADPAYRISYRSFDLLDGLPDRPPGATVMPVPIVARTNDGRIWFATNSGIAFVDPRHLPINQLPPPVHIETMKINGRDVSPTEGMRLAPHTGDLEIDYTALSLSIPERVLFRYMLEGKDTEWRDVGTRRQAYYTGLGPGDYRFRVRACNNDGVWNEAGSMLAFAILPAWYQTSWFLAAWVAAAAMGLYLLYLLRLRQMTSRVTMQMQARVEERERIARDLHDTLLQSVQGLILKFHAFAKQVPEQMPVRRSMETALDSAEQTVTEGRERVRALRGGIVAVDDLPAAFQHVVEGTPQTRPATFRAVVEGGARRLHPMVLEESFAIGREALINALTHSEGAHIEAEMTYDARQFRLRIRDDGRGIDPGILVTGGRSDHWGLKGMRERASRIGARLEFWSRPGAGTEVELIVPAAAAYRAEQAGSRWFRLRRS